MFVLSSINNQFPVLSCGLKFQSNDVSLLATCLPTLVMSIIRVTAKITVSPTANISRYIPPSRTLFVCSPLKGMNGIYRQHIQVVSPQPLTRARAPHLRTVLVITCHALRGGLSPGPSCLVRGGPRPVRGGLSAGRGGPRPVNGGPSPVRGGLSGVRGGLSPVRGGCWWWLEGSYTESKLVGHRRHKMTWWNNQLL